ncbi:MAG TPA: AMP-binding protein [Solirubrobacterales bacterium]|nr:AMP-binding protein [Solirubrobacterales bacterium]
MWIEATTIGDLLHRTAEESDNMGVVFPDVRVTWKELADRSDRMARGLIELGVGAGDKVGALMPNSLDFITAIFAATKLGAVIVPINGRFKERELEYVIAHADIKVLFVAAGGGGANYPTLLEGVFPELASADPQRLELAGAPLLNQIVNVAGTSAGALTMDQFNALAEKREVAEVRTMQKRVRIRDVAVLMYTSGTTSRPKGCLLSHEALVRQGSNVAITRFWLTEEDRFWDPLPLFHCGGFVPMLGCCKVGATYYHAGHFDPTQSIHTLAEEKITVAYPAFEPIWLAILNHPEFDDLDLTSIRVIQNIAIPERLAQFEKKMPWAVQVTSYGSTECATNLTLPLPDDPYDVRINTLGTPVEGMEIKIVDPEGGEERPVDEVGELCFRGYSRFEGYYKDPEQTAATVDDDGWFHTGDLGSVDDGGHLRYAGRLKDMLKVGGENVSALEVEDYLASHPAVEIVQVVAAPDDRYLEVPCAYIELKQGASATEEELIAYCVGKIASYKVPRYVRFTETWPMSGTKVQKFVLRDQIAKDLKERGISEAPPVATPSVSNAG